AVDFQRDLLALQDRVPTSQPLSRRGHGPASGGLPPSVDVPVQATTTAPSGSVPPELDAPTYSARPAGLEGVEETPTQVRHRQPAESLPEAELEAEPEEEQITARRSPPSDPSAPTKVRPRQ